MSDKRKLAKSLIVLYNSPMSRQEILTPSPEIAWGKNTYDASGDLVGEQLGAVRIGIGRTLYDLHEDPNRNWNLFLTTREVNADKGDTRLYLGYPGRMPFIKISASREQPFSLDDPARINAAAACARRLSEVDISYINSLKVMETYIVFQREIGQLTQEAGVDLGERIAVFANALEAHTKEKYPKQYLAIADDMDELGIAEMDIGRPGGSIIHAARFKSEWIRKNYSSQQNNAAA